MSRGWGNGFWFIDLRRKVAGGPPESESERVGRRSGLGYGSRVCCGGARHCIRAGSLDDHAGFGKRPRLFPIEAFIAEAVVERFNEAILPRTGGLDVDRLNILLR